jgi:hypothetical protein
MFSGGMINFCGEDFDSTGASFDGAVFSGGTVDLSSAEVRSVNVPWKERPPTGLLLPPRISTVRPTLTGTSEPDAPASGTGTGDM